jgi:ABC-type sugar transport system substrate-binding protein
MRLALVSLFLLLMLAICSAAALAQPTIYVLSVKESQGWWTDLKMLAAETQVYLQRAGKALGLSFSIEVIDSIERWDKFVAEAPPYAVIINAHGELVPVPPRYGRARPT